MEQQNNKTESQSTQTAAKPSSRVFSYNFLGDINFIRIFFAYHAGFWLISSMIYILNGYGFTMEYLFRIFLSMFSYAIFGIIKILSPKQL